MELLTLQSEIRDQSVNFIYLIYDLFQYVKSVWKTWKMNNFVVRINKPISHFVLHVQLMLTNTKMVCSIALFDLNIEFQKDSRFLEISIRMTNEQLVPVWGFSVSTESRTFHQLIILTGGKQLTPNNYAKLKVIIIMYSLNYVSYIASDLKLWSYVKKLAKYR